MKFYKYLSLSEEKNFGPLKSCLAQEIWLAPLKDFNDPFEGRFSLIPLSAEYILDNPVTFNNFLKERQVNGEPNLTAEEFKLRLLSKEFQEKLKENPKFVTDMFSNHGALCLTIKNNDIPMWAYYADDHKGCCVEFELDFSYIQEHAGIAYDKIAEFMNGVNEGSDILSFGLKNQSQKFVFAKILYDSKLPKIYVEEFLKLRNQYDKIEYLIRHSVGVKPIEWQHENEFRLVANSNSSECGLLPLKEYAPFLRVTGVIIGSNAEEKNESRLRDLCIEYNVSLYKAACSDSDYEITILPIIL